MTTKIKHVKISVIDYSKREKLYEVKEPLHAWEVSEYNWAGTVYFFGYEGQGEL